MADGGVENAVDYYVASYKCAHCEKETGESFILQAESPVPVIKKSMAAPANCGAYYAGEVPERRSALPAGRILEESGRGSAAQYNGKLDHSVFALVSTLMGCSPEGASLQRDYQCGRNRVPCAERRWP